MAAENKLKPGKSVNKHLGHREEVIHSDASRAFLTDPMWPRTNIAPNLSHFSDRKVTPVMRVKKMHAALIDAQNRALDTTEKISIVDHYKKEYNRK